MTPIDSIHLSEEELDDILIGLRSPQSEAHLAGCMGCRAKVREFKSDMELFNSASIAWSQSRPIERLHITARDPARPRLAIMSWAATVAVLALTAVGIWHHNTAAPPNHAAATQSQPVDSEAQIAQDNQLLREVNAAISPDEESPIEQYNLSESSHSDGKARHKSRTK